MNWKLSTSSNQIIFVCGLFVFLALAQIAAHRDFLHDEIMRSSGNEFGDALEYARRATRLTEGDGFANIFGDGYRTPGYPALLALSRQVSDTPWLTARYAQIFLTSLLPFLAYVMARRWLPADRWRLMPAAAMIFWPPFYYFSSTLTAESVAIIFTALLFVVSSACYHKPTTFMAIITGLLIVFITTIKPNNIILIATPVALVYFGSGSTRNFWSFVFVLGATVAVCIAPWTIFVSLANERFIPLTTNQGIVLCSGVGGVHDKPGEMLGVAVPNLMDLAREVLSIDVNCSIKDAGSITDKNSYFQRISLDHWRQHPFATTSFGIAKMLHLLGFSLRGPADYGSAAMNLASIVSALWLIRRRQLRPLGMLYFVVLGLAMLQAFIFLPDQRFRVAWVDFLGIWIISAAVYQYFAGVDRISENQSR